MRIPYLIGDEPFPPVDQDIDGILAVGGILSSEKIIEAYKLGIFPWYSAEDPIIWWSPNPRFVLYPEELRVSKSMRKLIRDQAFKVTIDQAFDRVIDACGSVQRKGEVGTWLTEEMKEVYSELHHKKVAHSVEVWSGSRLVGGLYGLGIGQCFFGESMFFLESNASKYGFIKLVRHLNNCNYQLIDCQVETAHLGSLGAKTIPRGQFIDQLSALISAEPAANCWNHVIL